MMEINYYSLLLKTQLTPNQHYLLYCCKNKIKSILVQEYTQDVKLLQVSGFLNENNTLTEKAERALDTLCAVFRKTKPAISEDLMGENFLTHITEYRSYFPTIKKSTPAEIKNKFAKLFAENPGITWDNLIRATLLYFSEERDEKYIYKAANFIMVQRNGANTYPILEYYERIEEGEKVVESTVNMYKIL